MAQQIKEIWFDGYQHKERQIEPEIHFGLDPDLRDDLRVCHPDADDDQESENETKDSFQDIRVAVHRLVYHGQGTDGEGEPEYQVR